MEGILRIFDYFKEAFNTNKANKLLYKPQIILAVLKTLIMLSVSLLTYYYIRNNISDIVNSFPMLMRTTLITTLGIIGSIALVFLLTEFLEAGLWYMYYKGTTVGMIESKDFLIGARKYFAKFVIGDILIFVALLFLLPLYLIVSLLSLGTGFVIIPFLVAVMLGMWKVSIVTDECGIFKAIGNSIKFSTKYLVPYGIFMIIVFSFSNPISKPGNFNQINNVSNNMKENKEDKPLERYQNNSSINSVNNNIETNISDGNNVAQETVNKIQEGNTSLYGNSFLDGIAQKQKNPMDEFNQKKLEKWLYDNFIARPGTVDIFVFAGLGVLGIGTIINALIKMLFQTFFGLSKFIVYRDKFKVDDGIRKEEGL